MGLARRLDLAAASSEGILLVGASVWAVELARVLKERNVPVLLSDANRHSLRRPAALGIRVYHGEVLSGAGEEDLDLYEIGYLLAATDNDAYNALVCTHFAPGIGHEQVFQLAMHEVDTNDPDAPRRDVHGRIIIDEWAYHEELLAGCRRGWRFEATRFQQESEVAEYLRERGEGLAPVLLLRDNGTLVFNAAGNSLPQPEAGDVLVAFVAPRRELHGSTS